MTATMRGAKKKAHGRVERGQRQAGVQGAPLASSRACSAAGSAERGCAVGVAASPAVSSVSHLYGAAQLVKRFTGE